MSPDEILRQFASRYTVGAAPLDDAMTQLATWMADRKEILNDDDVRTLISVGSTLFEKVVEAGWEHPGRNAGQGPSVIVLAGLRQSH